MDLKAAALMRRSGRHKFTVSKRRRQKKTQILGLFCLLVVAGFLLLPEAAQTSQDTMIPPTKTAEKSRKIKNTRRKLRQYRTEAEKSDFGPFPDLPKDTTGQEGFIPLMSVIGVYQEAVTTSDTQVIDGDTRCAIKQGTVLYLTAVRFDYVIVELVDPCQTSSGHLYVGNVSLADIDLNH
jgi:hypothetical protein